MGSKTTILISILASLIFLSGCSTVYRVKLNALTNPDINLSKIENYSIKSGNPRVYKEDLEYKKFEKYVKKALASQGWYEKIESQSNEADMNIDIAYGVSQPKIIFKKVTRPVQTSVTISMGSSRGQRTGSRIPVRVTRMENVIIPTTEYEKFLRITARENTEDSYEMPVQIFTVYIKIQDKSNDLGKYMPVLVAVMMDHIGKETDNTEEIKITANDEAVEFILQD